MHKLLLAALSVSLFASAIFFGKNLSTSAKTDIEKSPEPSDYLWAQRAFPHGKVPTEAYYAAIAQAKNQAQARDNSLQWQLAGPTNVSGRITDIAMHPGDAQTVYVATATGGVWKSGNAGDTWQPISDQLPTLSIGDIAIDPSDKNTIYVGTGEPNAGGGSLAYDGRGIFRSTDGGQSWTPLGLEQTGSIGRIEIDPKNPQRIFVAAMGHLFGNNAERGIFRSTDGGQSWQKTLFVNDSTGGIDLAIHPLNPDTVFAVSWQRVRRPNQRMYGGPGCAIWRSTDGGSQWTKLGTGLPTTNLGRIGIAISPSQPNVLYAIYANEAGSFKGVYKSQNNGNSWTLLPGGDPGFSGFGWWFGQIRIAPTNPNEVYTFGVDWQKTTDGGQFWYDVSGYLHADYHAFYIHPANPNLHIVGNDGGIYISKNGGISWAHRPFPITQFYTAEIDFQNPHKLYGGAQDNGTWRTPTGGLSDWEPIGGGDGFVTLVSPDNPFIYYVESQYGGLAGSNGASAPASNRYNWNTPYIFDPNNPDIMYIGAERVFKSTNGGLDWAPISNDLSNGPTGMNGIRYGTVTSLAASPLNANTLWVGTDDGNVWITQNGGDTWTKVSASLPMRWVTRVVADPENANSAWLCLSGYRYYDNAAHVYRTTDGGQTWQNLSGNLPDVPVNDFVYDPERPGKSWYVATDAGVWCTTDAGASWQACNQGLPTVPVLDLSLHAPTRALVAATYGRSMYRAELPDVSSAHAPKTLSKPRFAPNPFATLGQVSFAVFEKQHVEIRLFDLSGMLVKKVFAGELIPGEHQFSCSAENLGAGIYFLKVEGANGAGFCEKIVKL